MPVVSVLTVFAYQNIVLMLKILYSHKAGNSYKLCPLKNYGMLMLLVVQKTVLLLIREEVRLFMLAVDPVGVTLRKHKSIRRREYRCVLVADLTWLNAFHNYCACSLFSMYVSSMCNT